MKRIMAALLALCVTAGTVSYPAGMHEAKAAEAREAGNAESIEDGFEYKELEAGKVEIIKYKGSANVLAIPFEIDGKMVVKIGMNAFSGCSQLESVTIPEGVKEIEEEDRDYGVYPHMAFDDCENLTEIIVEEGNAWYSSQDGILYNESKTSLLHCPKGKRGSITIPESVAKIGYLDEEYGSYMPLNDCKKLTEIIVGEGNAQYSSKDGVLYDKSMATLLCCPAGKQGDITIPESVTAIATYTWRYKRELGPIYSVKVLGYNALSNCPYLSKISVDSGNTEFSSLEGVLYNSDRTKLLCCPAGKKGSLVIPEGVRMIGDKGDSVSFYNCRELTSITIPESVMIVSAASFFGCSNLTEIVVDANSRYCSSLDGILYKNVLNEYEESIVSLIFCPAGKQGIVTVPDNVAQIERGAFYGCSNLERINISKDVTDIAYDEYGNLEYTAFKGCSRLAEIVVDKENVNYCSSDGALYYIGSKFGNSGTRLVCCPAGKQGAIDVQEKAQYIEASAFIGCGGITGIAMPKSIASIGDEESSIADVFSDCTNLAEITVNEANRLFSVREGMLYLGRILQFCPAGKQGSVTIPQDITGIAEDAFSSCKRVTEIMVDKNNGVYISLDGILYRKGEDAAPKSLIRCPAGKEGRITVADGVQIIGDASFEGCLGVEEVVMPGSVEEIGYNAFYGCGDDLCIYCAKGSYAEGYAKKHGMDYSVISKKPQTITASNHTKTVGDAAFPIGASTDGDGVLSYQSSDESVVIVSSKGVAAVIGAGTAQVTIAAAETSEYEAAQKVITITVNPASGAGENPPPADLAGTSYDIGGCTYTITSTEPKEACFTSLNDDRTVVTIPNLVTINGSTYEVSSIAERACYGIEALQRVRVGANVKEIGAGAFAGCTALEQAIVPESVQTIGEGAFAGSSEGLCMVCARGSAAEAYAVENGIRHKASADEKEPQTIMAGDFEKTFGDGPFPIGASTDGDGALSYESDNEAVAVVSAKGTVVLMGAGTARITIKASETENYGPAEKTIAVTVSPKPGGDQKPGGAQKPDAGGSSQEKPENKKTQTVTAADLAKTYGDRPFSIGAKSSGGGALSYAVKNPAVASVDGNGAVTLKCCGVTEIVITAAANGRYQAASKTITLTVAPKKLSGTSAKSTKAKTLTVKWKKDKAATGYIIECSTDKKFRKNVKTATVKKNKTVSKKLTNLKGGKRYYVRACAYVQAGGAKIKGAYRTIKKAVKVKK